MDILQKVVKPTEKPTRSDEDALFRFQFKEIVAQVITQTYDYMIRMGVKYAYITTDEAYVFLHVRKDDPSTLYYHLIKLEADVEQNADDRFRLFRSAVGQMLTFCLLALGSRPRLQR